MNKDELKQERKMCQSIGCNRVATKVLTDGKGRKSYRCEFHGNRKKK